MEEKKDGDSLIKEWLGQYTKSLVSQMTELNLLNDAASNSSMYNPILGQEFTQNINIHTRVPSQQELTQWLIQPHIYSKELRDTSQFLENSIMQYMRSIKHFSSIMTFRYDLRPCDVNDDLIDNADYMNSYKTCLKVLQKINIPFQFPKINWGVMEEGIKFYWIQENDTFMNFLELPSDYCYVVGYWDMGYVGAFDLTFFDRATNVEPFTPEFYKAYQTLIEARKAGLKGNALSSYQYMPLPVDKSWIFAFNPAKAVKAPPLMGVFKDSMEILNYKNLLKQKSILDTYKIILQQIPYDEKNNKFLLEYNQARDIINMTQQLLPPGVRTFATMMKPMEMTMSQSQSMNNINGLGESLYWQSIGVAGNLFGGGENKNALGLKYSLQTDFDLVSHLYIQYSNFVAFRILLKTKKYNWRVSFYGSSMTEADDIKLYSSLVSTNNFPVSKLFGLCGYQPFEVASSLNWENKLGLKEKLLPIVSAFQTNNDGGRPTKDLSEMESGGLNQVDNDSNAQALK